jgi:hypothetical protein
MLDQKFVKFCSTHTRNLNHLGEIIISLIFEEFVVFIPEYGSASVFCVVVVTQAASLLSFF